MKRKRKSWKQKQFRIARFSLLRTLARACVRKVRTLVGRDVRGGGLGRGGDQVQVSLLHSGLSAPLLWLQNCLARAADDREEAGECIGDQGCSGPLRPRTSPASVLTTRCGPAPGCSQGVPLVPLTEENEEAMENAQFQHLLRKLGIRPPISGQASVKAR